MAEITGKPQASQATCRFCGRPVGVMRRFFLDARTFWCPDCWIHGPVGRDKRAVPDPRTQPLLATAGESA